MELIPCIKSAHRKIISSILNSILDASVSQNMIDEKKGITGQNKWKSETRKDCGAGLQKYRYESTK